jgi:hypothetical protein
MMTLLRVIAITILSLGVAASGSAIAPTRIAENKYRESEAIARVVSLPRLVDVVGPVVPKPRPPSRRPLVAGRSRPHPRRLPRVPRVRARVLALGDSVMRGATSQLRARMRSLYVDAAVGRQVSDGIRELRRLKSANRLGEVVVVQLGNNGRFTSSQFSQIMSVLSSVRKVVFVNLKVPRSWEASDNRVIAAGVRRYARAVLVDWHALWRRCPGHVFARDGYHLTAAGGRCYAAYVAAAI